MLLGEGHDLGTGAGIEDEGDDGECLGRAGQDPAYDRVQGGEVGQGLAPVADDLGLGGGKGGTDSGQVESVTGRQAAARKTNNTELLIYLVWMGHKNGKYNTVNYTTIN